MPAREGGAPAGPGAPGRVADAPAGAGALVEEAGPERLDELVAWRMETLSAVFGAEGVELGSPGEAAYDALEAANRAYYEREIPAGGHVACLVSVDGRVVGCGGICLQRELPSPDNPDGICAYLMNIYTRPAWQHRGLGRLTVEWLVARARERGADKVYLETSAAGRRLYERVGFKEYPDMMKL